MNRATNRWWNNRNTRWRWKLITRRIADLIIFNLSEFRKQYNFKNFLCTWKLDWFVGLTGGGCWIIWGWGTWWDVIGIRGGGIWVRRCGGSETFCGGGWLIPPGPTIGLDGGWPGPAPPRAQPGGGALKSGMHTFGWGLFKRLQYSFIIEVFI